MRPRFLAGAAAAVIVASAATAGVVSGEVSSGTTERAQACFTLDDWNAPQGKRPCVEVKRVYEDGSFVVKVTDASGTVRYTRGVGVPNSYERTER